MCIACVLAAIICPILLLIMLKGMSSLEATWLQKGILAIFNKKLFGNCLGRTKNSYRYGSDQSHGFQLLQIPSSVN